MFADLACDFGNVSIGDETVRVGIKIDREDLSLEQADELFSSMRLQGKITLKTKADEQQQNFEGMDDVTEIETTFDVKRFSVKRKEISCGLTSAIGDISITDLAHFAKRTGRLIISDAEPLAEGKDSNGSIEPLEGQGTFDMDAALGSDGDEGALMDLSCLETRRLRKITGKPDVKGLGEKKIATLRSACKGGTIGDFENWIRSNIHWESDLKGFGGEWITVLSDAHLMIRDAYPIPQAEES